MNCSFCGQDKPEEAFPPAPTASGRSSKCIQCIAQEQKPERLQASSELLKPSEPPLNPWIEQKRLQNEARRRALANSKQSPPERIAARKAVARAIKQGELQPKPCEIGLRICEKWPVEFHHTNYEPGHELEGKWACKACHNVLSARARRKAEEKRRNTC